MLRSLCSAAIQFP